VEKGRPERLVPLGERRASRPIKLP
jgi:hypothetical protein